MAAAAEVDQPVQDSAAVGASVDGVARRRHDVLRPRADLRERRVERRGSAVDVADRDRARPRHASALDFLEALTKPSNRYTIARVLRCSKSDCVVRRRSRVILFDIRTDDSHAGFIAAVNRGLDSVPGNPYLARFGHVCSPRWWACFDRGELPVKVLTGIVSHVGPRRDFVGELEDVVEFDRDGRATAYDRLDHWAAHPIRVGDRICIIRTEAELHTPTGPIRSLIDLRAEWFPTTGHPTP